LFLSQLFFFCLKETGAPPGSSRAASRLTRETPLRRPPVIKPVASSKPARIPVKQIPQIPVIISESTTTQTVETRAKTPRQFSSSFSRFIDKLKELNWFEEQYPLIKIDVCVIYFNFKNKIFILSFRFFLKIVMKIYFQLMFYNVWILF